MVEISETCFALGLDRCETGVSDIALLSLILAPGLVVDGSLSAKPEGPRSPVFFKGTRRS